MLRVVAILLVAVIALSACGSGADGGSAQAPPEPPAAKASDFPSAKGKTLTQLIKGLKRDAVLLPSSATSQQAEGENRLGFVIVDLANKRLEPSAVAVYTAREDGTQLRGPFVARRESLEVATPFRSAQTVSDLADGKSFFLAAPEFASAGQQVVVGIAQVDGEMVVADPTMALAVGGKNGPPDVGDRAIRIHTLTPSDVGGDLTKLTTRVPPAPELLKTDFADVLGKKPVVLQFATPALCSSRTCGPVVDIAEQVRAQNGEGVAFIQQEIYVDNSPPKLRPQVEAWRLQTEPWLFVVDRTGKITARFEGVFSAGELTRAVAAVQ